MIAPPGTKPEVEELREALGIYRDFISVGYGRGELDKYLRARAIAEHYVPRGNTEEAEA